MSDETSDEAPKADAPLGVRELWRDLVAPSAARLAMLAAAKQFRAEGLTREDFLTQCGGMWDAGLPLTTSPADESEAPTT